MALEGVITEVLSAITEDAVSPIPGFVTLLTIARLVSGHMSPKAANGELSRRQVLLIKRILDGMESVEKRRIGRKTYYRYL
jgi:hypothetical protein